MTDPHEPHHGVDGERPRSYRGPFIILAVILGLIVVAAIVWAVVATSGGGGTPTAAPTSASPTPTPTPTETTPPPPAPEGACSFDDLTVTLGEPEGAAGSTVVPILFENSGSAECTVSGYPTVAFVGDGDGTQLGAAATEDATSTVATVSLAPGATAAAGLTVTDSGAVDDCEPVDADGFRVYPPGSNDAAFLATTDYQACSNTTVTILTVAALAAQ
ncbi:MAG TPA: DUF4232 domain-containing protein [Rhodoglobus sp.]|nr:DUF4232 domain-containing protein [Rhodoglobus sp.]